LPLGPWELGIILLIVIIIFGVGKLPQIGGALGQGIREFRTGAADPEADTRRQEEERREEERRQMARRELELREEERLENERVAVREIERPRERIGTAENDRVIVVKDDEEK
jgi:sec-independent protein translocase protein TatA